jgi:DNA-binding transcriptional LysR family regulator
MKLLQIETFAAVMMCGTTVGAAESLEITHPAVSRSIAELERSIGFPLFARTRSRLVATPEDRILYDEVKATLHGLDTIRTTAERIRDHGSGEVHVASLFAASQ